MKKLLLKSTWMSMRGLLVGFIVIMTLSTSCFAADFEKPSEAWKLSQGGKIYDNWFSTLKTTVQTNTHPAYPSTGKKKGRSTWRCKECHGWDYRGRDGAYSKGSHYTGIKGIRDMVGKPMGSIKSVVRNEMHGYTTSMISDKALDYLAYFITNGQLDMTQYIDTDTKKVKGSVQHGADFFQTICAVCHGPDGRKINFHAGEKEKEPEYIGTVANSNPWEVLHKIRNGQPGAAMISLRVLSIQDQVDIIAYTKLLPIK